jgi:uncharacterized surface protein with fasciclin (FAS1) repeats
MSFALPTTVTIVDKYPPPGTPFQNVVNPFGLTGPKGKSLNLLDAIEKYTAFRELVKIAGMDGILNDPQTKLTLFVPIDLLLPTTTLKACIDPYGPIVQDKIVPSISFETARKMVNSVIVPSELTTTMIIQSAFTRYKTRDQVNTLTMETVHCVQFEPTTFTRPPFGILVNGKARILTPDTIVSNGIVHTIDKFPYEWFM